MAQYQWTTEKWGLKMAKVLGADFLEVRSIATHSLQKQFGQNIAWDTTLVTAIAINGHENHSKYFIQAYITTSILKSQEKKKYPIG